MTKRKPVPLWRWNAQDGVVGNLWESATIWRPLVQHREAGRISLTALCDIDNEFVESLDARKTLQLLLDQG